MALSSILASAAITTAGSLTADAGKKALGNVPEGNLRSTVNAVHKQWQKGAGGTIVTAGQNQRVEPIVLVDDRVTHLTYIKDVMEAAQRLFTCHYMLAVAAENTVGNLTVSQRLGKYSPDRNLMQASAQFLSMESLESNQYGLDFNDGNYGMDAYRQFSPEAAIPTLPEYATEAQDLQKQVMDIANLSIGQVVNLEIKDGSDSAVVPVAIRMRTVGVKSGNISDILGLGMEDNSRAMKIKQWRMDMKSLKDLLFNLDEIRAYRTAVMNDKSGYFQKAHKRQRKGLWSTFMSGEPTIGAISSMCVMSAQTRTDIENKHFGSLDDPETRQRVFEKSLMLMMFVVNDDNDTLTVYTRDIEEPSTYPIADLKGSSKQQNPDLTSLLNVMLSGRLPGRL